MNDSRSHRDRVREQRDRDRDKTKRYEKDTGSSSSASRHRTHAGERGHDRDRTRHRSQSPRDRSNKGGHKKTDEDRRDAKNSNKSKVCLPVAEKTDSKRLSFTTNNSSSSSSTSTSSSIVVQEKPKSPLISQHPLQIAPKIGVPKQPVTVSALGVQAAAVPLPSYYNPNAINVARYKDQIQKRKLLWSNKKAEKVDEAAAKWQETAQFSKDDDGKVASKFMRLMGIKQPPSSSAAAAAAVGEDALDGEEKKKATPPSSSAFAKKQADMFSTMEQQYEVARQATHTMRGVGLGFSSQGRPY